MSEAHFRRILLLVVLVITFYLPGTLAIAAPDDHPNNNSNGHGQGEDSPTDHDNGYGNDGQPIQQGNENNSGNGKSNPHGQGQDSPADHDNGYGNDDPTDDPPVVDEEEPPTNPSSESDAQEPILAAPVPEAEPQAGPTDPPIDPNAHGQGQDSPADHDNGYGNDPTPPDDPPLVEGEPSPTDTVDDSDPQEPVLPTPVPEADPEPEPTDIPEGPNGHGQGQDSPADHDNGYGNDDPLVVNEEPRPADTAADSEAQNPVVSVPFPDLKPTDQPGVDEAGPGAEPPAGSAANQPPPEMTSDNPALDNPPPVSASVKEPPSTDQTSDQNDAEPAPSDNNSQPLQGDLLNEPPVATPGQTVVFAGSTTTIDLSSFVSDGDGDILALTPHSLPDHGTLTVTNGVALFTPEPGFFGVETLRFTACDPSGACIDTTVSVYVPPVNDILIATNDTGILSRFIIGADQGLSQQELVVDLLTDSATRLAVPMAGAVSVIGGSLLFGLQKIGTRFDLLRLLLRHN